MIKVTRLTPLAAICFASLAGTIACGDDESTPILPIGDGGATDDTDTDTDTTGSTDTDTDTDTDDSNVTLPDAATTDTMDGGTESSPDGAADGGDGGPEQLPTISALVNGSAEFTVLASALADTGLDDTLNGEGPFTVFAPTDEAFALLPDGLVDGLSGQELIDILRYHVVEGEVDSETVITLTNTETLLDETIRIQVASDGVYLNGLTKLVTTDIETSNGVVHVIDSVLVPGAFPGTVADVLGAYPRLSILFGAATTEVNEALSDDDITLFAPINGAFFGVDLEGVDDLDPLLMYHVLPDSTSASALTTVRTARTAGGAFMGLRTTDDGVELNDGSMWTALSYTDIQVASGAEGSTIHLIEEVLTPPPNLAQVAADLGLTDLVDALALASVPGTETTFAAALAGAGTFTVFAPTNDAFDALSAIGFGLDMPDVLGAHAMEGVFDSAAAIEEAQDNGQSPETLTGAAENTLGLSIIGSSLAINSMVQVTEADIPASNGILHIVDSVIVPADVEFPGNIVETLSAYPLFSSLVEATGNAEDADLAAALAGDGPFTLFAPVNPAFDGIDTTSDLSEVLEYHAIAGTEYDSAAVLALDEPTAIQTVNGAAVTVNGDDLTVNGSAILGTDIRTSNGVIHVIGEVLSLPND